MMESLVRRHASLLSGDDGGDDGGDGGVCLGGGGAGYVLAGAFVTVSPTRCCCPLACVQICSALPPSGVKSAAQADAADLAPLQAETMAEVTSVAFLGGLLEQFSSAEAVRGAQALVTHLW